MNKPFRIVGLAVLLMFAFAACDEEYRDIVPESFFMIQVNPDDIYMINSGNPMGVRLDPLVNDSIKVDVTIAYSVPRFGNISFVDNEGWFYKPNAGFYGIDNITYNVCYEGKCYSASITMYVEQPYDPANCTYAINGEAVETQKDQPLAIRIFDNDVTCPYYGSSISAPENGRFTTYTYSGSFKNTVYVYYPPKGFVGTDRFKYKLYTSDGRILETYCTITIK
jgi:hypothetical protein